MKTTFNPGDKVLLTGEGWRVFPELLNSVQEIAGIDPDGIPFFNAEVDSDRGKLFVTSDGFSAELATFPKVGDRVRLVGEDWYVYDDVDIAPGSIVEVTEIDWLGLPWAGKAGTVGNQMGYYSPGNPKGSGDYSVELVDEAAGTVYPVQTSEPVEGWIEMSAEKMSNPSVLESSFASNVRRITAGIADLLVEKNEAYGNSALNPVRVFSKADRTEQLKVRIDDKISRIQRGTEFGDEDTVRDLIGYLVLLLVAEESE